MTPTEAAAFSRRLLWLAGLLGLALVAVLVNAALNGGSDSGPANPIRAAALRTEREPGGHAAIEAIYSEGDAKVAATGRGVYDLRDDRSRATFVVPTKAGGRKTVHTLTVGDEIYQRSESTAKILAGGRRWLGFESWLGRNEEVALLGRWSPPSQLRLLTATGDDVERLGSELVLGVMTKRYGGTVDLSDYAKRLAAEGKGRVAARFRAWVKQVPAPIRVEAWVDAAGRLRRTRMVTSLPKESGGTITFDTRTDLTDFDRSPSLPTPKRAEVLDISPIFRWELGMATGAEFAGLEPTGPTLPLDRFRERARAACREIVVKGREVKRRAAPALARARRLSEETGLDKATAMRALNATRDATDIYFAPFLETLHHFVIHLNGLRPPATQAATYSTYLQTLAREMEDADAELGAIDLGAFGLAGEIGKEEKPLEHQSDALARKLGLNVCVEAVHSTESHQGESSHQERPSLD